MGSDDSKHHRRFAEKGCEDPFAERRVTFDMLELVGTERTWLVEHRFARPDLPDVMQLPTESDLLETIAGETELNRGLDRVPRDPGRVAAGVGILGFQCMDEHLHAVDQ